MRRQAPFLGILAAGLAVRVLFLGRAPLWADEVHTLEAISLPWKEMLGERFAAGHLPLYFLLVAAGFGRATTRERRFAVLLFVLPIAGPVAAGLILGVPWGPVRYSHLAAVPIALMAARAVGR